MTLENYFVKALYLKPCEKCDHLMLETIQNCWYCGAPLKEASDA